MNPDGNNITSNISNDISSDIITNDERNKTNWQLCITKSYNDKLCAIHNKHRIRIFYHQQVVCVQYSSHKISYLLPHSRHSIRTSDPIISV